MADAPRLRFYWSYIRERSILTMPRDEWEALSVRIGQPVEIDIQKTPLSGVARDSAVVASVAQQFEPATGEVSIFRYDKKDEPTPYNRDRYEVWIDLATHPRLPEMINAASTEDNENFRVFCREHVFLVKRERGPEHWLAVLPGSVKAVLRST